MKRITIAATLVISLAAAAALLAVDVSAGDRSPSRRSGDDGVVHGVR